QRFPPNQYGRSLPSPSPPSPVQRAPPHQRPKAFASARPHICSPARPGDDSRSCEDGTSRPRPVVTRRSHETDALPKPPLLWFDLVEPGVIAKRSKVYSILLSRPRREKLTPLVDIDWAALGALKLGQPLREIASRLDANYSRKVYFLERTIIERLFVV